MYTITAMESGDAKTSQMKAALTGTAQHGVRAEGITAIMRMAGDALISQGITAIHGMG